VKWELLAEKRIQAALERGEFDNLPGQGRPLRWRENPFLPRDWWLAFHLLEQAGLAPDWIVRDGEIRADLAVLDHLYRQQRLWMEERRTRMAAMSAEERAAERARLRTAQAQAWEQVQAFVGKVNRRIADFNLVVPIVRLRRAPVDLAEVQAALRAAWGSLDAADSPVEHRGP
jgi:hypothetical protein